jgi:deoxyadenosine/deoxycytidine kinase
MEGSKRIFELFKMCQVILLFLLVDPIQDEEKTQFKSFKADSFLSCFYSIKVFVRAVHEANWMNEMEISIYDSWFDPVVSCLPGLIPDGFIYLRASPDTCHQRMQLRKRTEEGGVSLDYLRNSHEAFNTTELQKQ